MKTRRIVQYVIVVTFILVAAGLLAFGKQEKAVKYIRQDNVPRFVSPPLPDSFSFCGEKVPLQRQDIREQFDREVLLNYYQPSNILYIIKLSHRYFPQIEASLKAHGIPEDMKYLCIAESNLQNLVSKVGATGFWQFMRETAPAYGLEVNSYVDERYHIEKSTDAACIYLKNAYKQFGSWTAAAAAYNCGQGGYDSHSDFQQTGNYYDLMLPEETNRYIFRILTFKYFMTRSEQLGFIISPEEGYPVLATRMVTVTQTVSNLAAFASLHGITYKTLRKYNPWLRGKSLPVKPGKKYQILLPAEINK